MSVLQIDNLSIRYPEAERPAVTGLSLSIEAGEAVGVVGESGSGKTQTALAIMGLTPTNAKITGSIRVGDTEINGANERTLRKIRARKVAMVFQDPGLSLNPYMSIGDQLMLIVRELGIASGRGRKTTALSMLKQVGLPDPERQMRCFPHQLSGGMRQRVMIAAALIGEPDLLIADEPTTALDVTIQAQILQLLDELRERSNTAMLLITHDLSVIAGHSERLMVMEHGCVIEEGRTTEVFESPTERTTGTMIEAGRMRAFGRERPAGEEDVLEVDDVSVAFSQRGWFREHLQAVLPLSFQLRRGETVAIVGESGSGKTSLARAILGLVPARTGKVSFLGKRLADTVNKRSGDVLSQMQMVFQDPLGSLNPAMRVGAILAEPLRIHRPEMAAKARNDAVADMLVEVGLDKALADRFPHELSGGQAQRVAIARALIIRPSVLVCDEAVAALDNTLKRGVLRLLQKEQADNNLSIIFISHDLSVVRQISDRTIVLYMGRVVETAATMELFDKPQHPYTRALLDAIPTADPTIERVPQPITGEVASLTDPPTGCVFHPRCKYATDVCKAEVPKFQDGVACHRAAEINLSNS